jgi:hypothetical protein
MKRDRKGSADICIEGGRGSEIDRVTGTPLFTSCRDVGCTFHHISMPLRRAHRSRRPTCTVLEFYFFALPNLRWNALNKDSVIIMERSIQNDRNSLGSSCCALPPPFLVLLLVPWCTGSCCQCCCFVVVVVDSYPARTTAPP